jgi:hypothetical protein
LKTAKKALRVSPIQLGSGPNVKEEKQESLWEGTGKSNMPTAWGKIARSASIVVQLQARLPKFQL